MSGFTGADGWVSEQAVRGEPSPPAGRSAHSSPPWYAILAGLPLPVELLAEARLARQLPAPEPPTLQPRHAHYPAPTWESVALALAWAGRTAIGAAPSPPFPRPAHSQPDRTAYPDATWQAPLVGAPSIRPHRGPPPSGASQAAQYLDGDGRLDPPILLPLASVALHYLVIPAPVPLARVLSAVAGITIGLIALAIVIPAPGRFGRWFKSGDDCVIPWCRIQKIGDDVILVDFRPPHGPGRVRSGAGQTGWTGSTG